MVFLAKEPCHKLVSRTEVYPDFFHQEGKVENNSIRTFVVPFPKKYYVKLGK